MAFRACESLDTNIILRLILGDIPRQCRKIQDLFMRMNVSYHVADLAVTEAVYVMQTVYGLPRGKIVEGIEKLKGFPGINYNRNLFDLALPMYLACPKMSFNDCCLAGYAALNQAEPLWTFDKALAKENPPGGLCPTGTAKLVG